MNLENKIKITNQLIELIVVLLILRYYDHHLFFIVNNRHLTNEEIKEVLSGVLTFQVDGLFINHFCFHFISFLKLLRMCTCSSYSF